MIFVVVDMLRQGQRLGFEWIVTGIPVNGARNLNSNVYLLVPE